MARDPKITVLMPVYNAALHLGQALESILAQSFSDFEFLIIDDASTDGSAALLAAFHDQRMRVVRNPVNLGVAATLNSGLQMARGQYIARMDADDISLPARLERQVTYLDSHPEVSVVGVKVVLIDADGNETGSWREDLETSSAAQIRATLPEHNCIAHPGVMIRRDAALGFGYRAGLPYAQDYELWLRMTAAGCRIEKLDEVLLKYRVHHGSITSQSNRTAADFKEIRIKRWFVAGRLAKKEPLTPFVRDVMKAMLQDMRRVTFARARAFCFAAARKTLLRTGMLLGSLLPIRNPSGLFFFFPFFHVGGAERVHADIVSAVADRTPWVFFTNRSANGAFRHLFDGKGTLVHLWPLMSHIVSRHLATGFLASTINRQRPCLVFGANSPFFYGMLPYLKGGVRRIDLLHAFGGGLEEVSLPHVELLDQRIVINRKTVDDLRTQYRLNHLPLSLLDAVRVIENKVEVPDAAPLKGEGGALRALYVGRGSAEKRVHIVGAVARLSRERDPDICFTLVGDQLSNAVQPDDRRYCRFTGEIHSYEAICDIYRDSDAILLTSSSEGFPMVVMEAMAHGVVPICTDVGGISVHIRHGVNGFLVPGDLEEEQIAESFAQILVRLQGDRKLLERMSLSAYECSMTNFSGAAFCSSYRSLFEPAGLGQEAQPW